MSANSADCSTVTSIFRHFSLSQSDPNCCRWQGVTCDNDDRVTHLRLNNTQISGTIPSQIGDLSSLEILYLFQNGLQGPIPASIGRLANLRELRLWGNKLSGKIPPELGNLSKLELLGLGTNLLDGPIPRELGNLGNLLELWLEFNQLDGAIPSSLANLSKLQGLYMANNTFSGPIQQLPNPSSTCTIVQPGGTANNNLCLAPSFTKSGRCWDHLAQFSLASCPPMPSPTDQKNPAPNATAPAKAPTTNEPSNGFPVAAIVGLVAGTLLAALVVLGLVKNRQRARACRPASSLPPAPLPPPPTKPEPIAVPLPAPRVSGLTDPPPQSPASPVRYSVITLSVDVDHIYVQQPQTPAPPLDLVVLPPANEKPKDGNDVCGAAMVGSTQPSKLGGQEDDDVLYIA